MASERHLDIANYSKTSTSRWVFVGGSFYFQLQHVGWNKTLLKAFLQMAAEQYIIILHNSEWKISFKDKQYGPYNTQGEAVEAARDAAFAMGEIGIDAQVLVQDGQHPLRTEWAYPQDFNFIMR